MSKSLPISISAISTQPLVFFEALPLFSETAKGLHLDVMDGQFVPRLGLFPEMISEISKSTDLFIDVHLMTNNPEFWVEELSVAGANRISPHWEATQHPHRVLSKITSAGIDVGVALNPGTPVNVLECVLHTLSSITLMLINPGVKGHKLIPEMLQKIETTRNWLDKHAPHLELEVDGGVTFDNARTLINAGADTLVCGAGTVFHQSDSIASNLSSLEAILAGWNE